MRNLVVSIVVAATLSACASVPAERVTTGRIYNLSTGEVFILTARTNPAGHSLVAAGPTKSGETFNGEATSIDNRIRSYGSSYGRVSNPGVLTDSYISTSTYATTTPGYQNGSAILIGSQGTVIDILYRVAQTGIGEGEGKDNKSNSYRIQFSPQR